MAYPLVQASHHSSHSQGKLRPALKLVKTQDLTHDQWLQVRQGGIGSSDAAAAVGLHPYKSPLQLWMEKTGRDSHLPKVDPNDDHSPMYWGTLLEPIVAAHYTRRTGYRVRRLHAVLQHPVELPPFRGHFPTERKSPTCQDLNHPTRKPFATKWSNWCAAAALQVHCPRSLAATPPVS